MEPPKVVSTTQGQFCPPSAVDSASRTSKSSDIWFAIARKRMSRQQHAGRYLKELAASSAKATCVAGTVTDSIPRNAYAQAMRNKKYLHTINHLATKK